MLLAYDDPTGVTAAFNLNLLARINRELGGDFILRTSNTTSGTGKWTVGSKCISARPGNKPSSIRAADFTCTFREGETIWTEACHKFRVEEIPASRSTYGIPL